VPREVSEDLFALARVGCPYFLIAALVFPTGTSWESVNRDFSISSLVSGFGGYGDEVYSELSRFNSKDWPRSHRVMETVGAGCLSEGIPVFRSLPVSLDIDGLLTRISRHSVTNRQFNPSVFRALHQENTKGTFVERRLGRVRIHDNVPNSTRIATVQLYSRGSNEKQANRYLQS
jgi:hypothetical protein